MSPRWTTRLDAHLGPRGLHLELARRLPWGDPAPLWQRAWPGFVAREHAADSLAKSLDQARADLQRGGHAWPTRLNLELDDAWVLHALLRGAFDRLGSGATAAAAAGFFQQALGTDAGTLRLALSPQPDGRGLWASALPEALCQALTQAVQAAGLKLVSLRPAAQPSVAGAARWPAHGVLALPHAAGVLLALRRDGSWVGLSNEHLALDDALTQRADALLRFHGVPAADGQAQGPREPQRWLRQDGKAALLAGWRRASAHGELV